MKITKSLAACISEGVKSEICGVGYLFTKGDISLVTSYDTSAVLYSFNNKEISIDIRSYDVTLFPFIMGKDGTAWMDLQQQSGAVDIRAFEVCFHPHFSQVKSTTYKSVEKNGEHLVKRKVSVSHFKHSVSLHDLSSYQTLTFILIAGPCGESCHVKGHHLIKRRLDEKVERDKNREKEKERYLQKRNERRFMRHPRIKYSTSQFEADDYSIWCNKYLDQKYIPHNKGKKFSKNFKVCMRNNNAKSFRSRDGNKGTTKREVIRKEKLRAEERASRDVKRVRKQARNWRSIWRCASGAHNDLNSSYYI
mmetsp:Transcript_20467/g.34455  ORF Transcript_20467/g.34455 Transcript_20467/m.34455 type:complete len:307 (-) Transcript_20467:677-1597(-)